MIETALKYIVGMSKPETLTIDGHTFSDKQLRPVSYNPKAEVITMTTLKSLVEYIKSGIDNMGGEMIVHVVNPDTVEMYSCLDHERSREHVALVRAQVPHFPFNNWTDHETFCIALQSKFIDTLDRALLLKFAGTVEGGSIAEYGDDGITQKATVKTGIASKGDAIIPNPVSLRAYRTFVEVEQPVTQYVFRMQDKHGIQCALFEADGGAWKIVAMNNIKRYLETELDGIPGFTVIS